MSQIVQPKDVHLHPIEIEPFCHDNDGCQVLVYRCQDTVTGARFNMRRDALGQFWEMEERGNEHEPIRQS